MNRLSHRMKVSIYGIITKPFNVRETDLNADRDPKQQAIIPLLYRFDLQT